MVINAPYSNEMNDSEILRILTHRHESLREEPTIFDSENDNSRIVDTHPDGYPIITDEFWTSKQRKGSSIHEISYRACFKPQLPNYFINLFTKSQDIVYDPFGGRGTTAIEAALLNRNVIINDVNPLSAILTKPRISIPHISEIEKRLQSIPLYQNRKANIDISMFYHPETESEIVSLRDYLIERKDTGKGDYIDDWIRMVATNRLSGHSKNFFSVYTLPPNQACSAKKQSELNKKYGREPEYKPVKEIILTKSYALQKDISEEIRTQMLEMGKKALFLNNDASQTQQIKDSSVSLVVTSPPFLDLIDYAGDNWLRCWFNDIDMDVVQSRITVVNKLDKWELYMKSVLAELFRVLKPGGMVAFEVGEVRNGKIKLDESILPLGKDLGFEITGVLLNTQVFTKTSNIWGVSNNRKGTNTNRIVLMKKRTNENRH
ncbi:MAG: DNA methyltransferase [Candidatus Cloacimonetes bacterium]|nr:DNA methyltransferase [Candidatus Cloacimonadota bacterium]